MTPEQIDNPAAFAISPQTARVVQDSWRFRVISELTARPLSPSRFVSEFGGELDRISRCFRELARWGYLELAEEVVGEARRGGVEHVYRLTRRRSYFEGQTWERLPRETREALSEPAVRSFHARTEEGIEAGTFDREVDRHLSLDAVQLDRAAWTPLMARLDGIMASLPGRAAAAARRLEGGGGEAIPTTLALAGFRSPDAPALAIKPRFWAPPREEDRGEGFAISSRLAQAMRNPPRASVLLALFMGPLSAPQYARKYGGSASAARRHFIQLAEWGLIDLAEERRGRRGSPEKVYRAKFRFDLDEAAVEGIPDFIREEVSVSILKLFWGGVCEAIQVGTFAQEADSHFASDRRVLDRLGWRELMAELGDCLSWSFELEREAADRLRRSGEAPIPTTHFLAGFRAPG